MACIDKDMLDVTILAVGKIKEKYFAEAISEYAKRLKPYASLKFVELGSIAFKEFSREKAKNDEGKKITSYLDRNGDKYAIILDERGINFSSQKFSKYLQELNKPIVFVVGGAVGLSKEVLERADYIMTLSSFTLPHELARLVLVEQIYRAVAIASNKTYHY